MNTGEWLVSLCILLGMLSSSFGNIDTSTDGKSDSTATLIVTGQGTYRSYGQSEPTADPYGVAGEGGWGEKTPLTDLLKVLTEKTDPFRRYLEEVYFGEFYEGEKTLAGTGTQILLGILPGPVGWMMAARDGTAIVQDLRKDGFDPKDVDSWDKALDLALAGLDVVSPGLGEGSQWLRRARLSKKGLETGTTVVGGAKDGSEAAGGSGDP